MIIENGTERFLSSRSTNTHAEQEDKEYSEDNEFEHEHGADGPPFSLLRYVAILACFCFSLCLVCFCSPFPFPYTLYITCQYELLIANMHT